MSYQQFVEIQSVLDIVLRWARKATGHFLREERKHDWLRSLSWSNELHDVDSDILCLYGSSPVVVAIVGFWLFTEQWEMSLE